jgi:hypothetical protein
VGGGRNEANSDKEKTGKKKKKPMSYQKFRKLAISNSVSSSLPRELERECEFVEPEPSLEMERLIAEVPRRCRTGREDLDLEGWVEEGERR